MIYAMGVGRGERGRRLGLGGVVWLEIQVHPGALRNIV